ncbi:MAG: hypothetical protein AB9866_03060 [Syntrophobacteraceae bacterium]
MQRVGEKGRTGRPGQILNIGGPQERKVVVPFIQTGRILVPLLVLCFLTVSGCSRENSRQKEGADLKPSTQETVEAIQGIGKKPIDAAKKAQAIGQGRTEDIDKAMEKLDKQ